MLTVSSGNGGRAHTPSVGSSVVEVLAVSSVVSLVVGPVVGPVVSVVVVVAVAVAEVVVDAEPSLVSEGDVVWSEVSVPRSRRRSLAGRQSGPAPP
ncbi:hypothetical protein [Nannocystis pusilla]|uniref:hypothetical protein n=1 Tax=Nannocystis pusilla TaxID=889268 RepID=UPI003B825E19